MSSSKVTIATRRSALALAQARAWMADLREATGVSTKEFHVVTTGDRVQDKSLVEIGGKGLFIKEVEEAILAGEADCAVHSLKDVPALLAPGLELGCIPRREDPRDVVKTRTGCRFEELPKQATVGTSSLRRVIQLRRIRPDLNYLPIRGNVDTRLRKCDEGEVDAVVLACAGMNRLGFSDRYTHAFTPEECLPAVGQGALAIEIKADDRGTRELLAKTADAETTLCVAAERGVMVAVEGSCQVPVAGYAVRAGDRIWLRAMLAKPDGSALSFRELQDTWPNGPEQAFQLGKTLGAELKKEVDGGF